MLQIILSFLKKQYFNIKMIKKYQLGFTLLELLVASLIIAFIAGSIMYGLSSSNNRLRNTELSQLAFNTLANKIEEYSIYNLKGEILVSENKKTNEINIENLINGTYIILIHI